MVKKIHSIERLMAQSTLNLEPGIPQASNPEGRYSDLKRQKMNLVSESTVRRLIAHLKDEKQPAV
jgi:hypothetical protein